MIPFGAGTGDYTYAYDAATGNLTGITSPAGEGLGFGYDALSRLISTSTANGLTPNPSERFPAYEEKKVNVRSIIK